MSTTVQSEKHAKYPTNIDHGVAQGGRPQRPHLIDEGLPGGGSAHGFFDPVSTEDSSVRNDKEEFGDDDYASSHLVAIKERQLTWPKAAALLFTEYVVLAILAFPSSFQVLGMAGGMIATVLIGLSTLYTSHVLWRYCMQNRRIRDIADVAYYLCGESRLAWFVAFIGLALNNLFIMGLHCNAGTTVINTLHYTFCSAVWGVILLIIMFTGSLWRDFRHATLLGVVSAGTMFVSYLVVVIGHSIQGTPNGYVAGVTDVSWSVWAPEGTTFVQGVSAILNIAYTFIGQALIPSFVGDMARPQDFPKALYTSMAAEIILFSTCGAIVYSHTGLDLTTAPAYGSLIEKYSKPAAALVLPTVIIVGIIYSLVTSRAVMFQIFPEKSIHRQQHTVLGWSVWVTIVAVGWIIAYIIGESIPFFNDLLSLISSLFDSWFGYILWACCFFQLYRRKPVHERTFIDKVEVGVNVVMLIVGLFFFGAGTYAAVQSIMTSYATGAIKKPFTCANTGFTFTR